MTADPAFCADCGVEQEGYTLTPVDVERAITKTLRDLRLGVTVIAEARDEADAAEVEFARWHAKAKVSARGQFIEAGRSRFSAAEVDDAVALTDDYKDEALRVALAKSGLERAKAYQRMLENRLDGLRTLSSSLRSQA